MFVEWVSFLETLFCPKIGIGLQKGWNCPQKKWGEWVDQLAQKYTVTWNKIGIFDAIMSSKYEVWCNKDLVLGLTEFWCDKTNTFFYFHGERLPLPSKM